MGGASWLSHPENLSDDAFGKAFVVADALAEAVLRFPFLIENVILESRRPRCLGSDVNGQVSGWVTGVVTFTP
ncbi:MAG: hypothetical protein AAGK37_19260 [Pseudomonadota bacterium]